MNIVLKDQTKCEIFHVIFQNIKLFTEHVNIFFKTDGIHIQTMDSSHISIFEMNTSILFPAKTEVSIVAIVFVVSPNIL